MTLEKELLSFLQDEPNTFVKNVQYANNAFKSSELPIQCKTILLKWILSCNDDDLIVWETVQNWFTLDSFKELTRNEIDNKEIRSIIEAIIVKVTSENGDIAITKSICNVLISLLAHRTFEQYFKTDVKLCLKLIESVLIRIECCSYFIEFLNQPIFYKSLLSSDGFLRQFLHIIFSTFVKCIATFDDHNTFLQVSKIVQKCIFYNNHKTYSNSINLFFENKPEDDSGLYLLLKHLVKCYDLNKKSPEMYYKLSFHALATAYDNDSLLIYKFFIILLHTIGFTYEDIPLESSLVPKVMLPEKSLQILLELLNVLEKTKLDLKSKVNEISLTDFLKTVLKQSILSDTPSAIHYQILKKIIIIDPTITQTLTEEVLVFSLLTNNADKLEDYEQLVLVIFDTFSKLHRIENLVSKIVSILNNRFDNATYKGNDKLNVKIDTFLTKNIFQSFSKNIQNLASWQVINVFKTFLFSLRKVVENKDALKSDNLEYTLHLEFLSELIGTFLSSIRVAEHTVAANVVEKTKKCLNELEDVLRTYGRALLKRKHNCSLMRSFLNIAYYWAEVSIVLRYYTVNLEDVPKMTNNHNFAACNITYVHPYLTVDEWCLISERITNFGELSCKQLLYKLFIQKVRALYIFEDNMNKEILQDLLRYLTKDLDDSWTYILHNRFLTNLLTYMDPCSINLLAEKLVTNITEIEKLQNIDHVLNNTTLLNAVVYCVIGRCDKIVSKRKRKHDEDPVNSTKLSSKIFNVLTLESFYNDDDCKNCISKMKKIYLSNQNEVGGDVKFSETKILEILEVLRKFPVIFCKESAQKFFIVYMFALHKDMSLEFSKERYSSLQKCIEDLILGVLQQYKYKLDDIFTIENICQDVLTHFGKWREMFILIMENEFKNKDAIVNYEPLIVSIADKLNEPTYMDCGIIILNILNKMKKIKMPKEIKTVVDNYKSIISNKMFQLVLDNDPQDYLIPGYAYTLKSYLTQEGDENIPKLMNVLEVYTNFALENHEQYDKVGYLQLFNTILQNKSKIEKFNEELPLKIWTMCKHNNKVYSRFDEYSQLILLIVGHISNDDFSCVTEDLLSISNTLIHKQKYEKLGNLLKTWESVLTSNVNPIKTKKLQGSLEVFLSKIIQHLDDSEYCNIFADCVLNYEITVVQTNHFLLSPAIVDLLLLSITVLLSKSPPDFHNTFNLATSLLSNLLKYRKSLIMDRLPPYLQQYRALLKDLCLKSDADVPQEEYTVRELADCAFQLEKLTKSLVAHQKDMSRIAMYLIADVLGQYEKVTIFPNVKMHLNNCVYSLITICDQHAISYLMRVLSSASTEIFKVMYDHYKKYYRFTGKA